MGAAKAMEWLLKQSMKEGESHSGKIQSAIGQDSIDKLSSQQHEGHPCSSFLRYTKMSLNKDKLMVVGLVTTALQGGGLIWGFSAFADVLVEKPGSPYNSDNVSRIFTIGHNLNAWGAIFSGFILDAYGPRVCAVTGFLMESLGHFLLAKAVTYPPWITYCAFGLLGIGGCQVLLSALAFVDAFKSANFMSATLTAAFQVGGFVFMILPFVDWKVFFYFYAGGCVFSAVLTGILYPDAPLPASPQIPSRDSSKNNSRRPSISSAAGGDALGDPILPSDHPTVHLLRDEPQEYSCLEGCAQSLEESVEDAPELRWHCHGSMSRQCSGPDAPLSSSLDFGALHEADGASEATMVDKMRECCESCYSQKSRTVWFLITFMVAGGAFIYGEAEFPGALASKDHCVYSKTGTKVCEHQGMEDNLNEKWMPLVGNFVIPCALAYGKLIDRTGFAIPAFINIFSVQVFLLALWLFPLPAQYFTLLFYNVASTAVWTMQNAYVCAAGNEHMGFLFGLSNFVLGLGNVASDYLAMDPFGEEPEKGKVSLAISCMGWIVCCMPLYYWVFIEHRHQRNEQAKKAAAKKAGDLLIKS
mmetsp:Transcript_142657/g.251836  ORF Transcript_142657/g.251836 Transcript_142657/m.251836 type:complete len:585 (+) Transcript_142657:43-1797(+)